MLKVSYLQSITVIGVIVILLTTIEGIAGSDWKVVTELPTKRVDFATAVVDGKIYLIGGTFLENAQGRRRENEPGIWRGPFGISTVEVYDPRTNTWERVADMPAPRANAEAAVVGGKIYVIGGYTGIDNRGENLKVLKVVEVYNPQTDTWERKQDMSLPRVRFGTGVVAGRIYAIGGWVHPRDRKPGMPGRIGLVEVYDPDTDTWAKRKSMPTRRTRFGTAVVNDQIYAIGGHGWPQVGNRGGPFLINIEAYHPKINRWKKQNSMPNLRRSFSTIVVGDDIYLIGGLAWPEELVGIGKYLGTIDVYSPDKGKWSDISSMPTAKAPFASAVVDGRIYVFGGSGMEGGDWVDFPVVEVFDTGLRPVSAKGKLSTRWAELKAKHQSQP